ncbi:MAG TPA: MmgE/PrpD family protein [Methylomirabilota bacterium]|nr:MmgE/PrpD family protein [Methylomirabilota bacterium]
MTTATQRLAEFVGGVDLAKCPDAARVQVRRAALDTIGVMLAGAGEPVATITRTVARIEGGAPLCTVIGSALRTSPTWAALCNGAAGHAHDFDDTNFALLGHPSVPLLATALACAESETTDGAAVMLAYLIGFEVSTALGLALNPGHYTRGWHATATLGTIGCAAAAARLQGLGPAQTTHALGIAASLASGLKENFGSMTKPYHAGHAALNAVTATSLARAGMTASAGALDGSQGFAAAFSGEKLALGAFDELGREWQIVRSGIAVKPYPSCALTHSAIDALIALRAAHGITPEQVEDVEVGVNHVVPEVLRYPTPTNGLERKFSMPYCAAAALGRGRVGIDDFEDGPVRDASVAALASRVRMVVDPSLSDQLEQHAWSRVTVRLSDGRTLGGSPRGASGHPATPLTDAQLHEKFLGCAAGVLGRGNAEAVAGQITQLELVPDIRALTARLTTDKE